MYNHHTNSNRNDVREKPGILESPILDNIAQKRSLIQVAFALAILFFFFSFCEFRCNGSREATLKGINLVTGTHLKMKSGAMLNSLDMLNNGSRNGRDSATTRGEKVPANIWAILAFAAAITGFVVFYRKKEKEALIGTIAGAAGVVSLLILRSAIKNKIEQQSGGMISIETNFLFGYWATFLAFLTAAGISYLRLRAERNTKNGNPQTIPPPSTSIHVNIIAQDDDTPSN